MNKTIAIIIGAVIVAGGGAAFLISRNNDNSVKVTNTATGQSQDIKTGSNAYVAVDACDILTDSVAKQILGNGAVKGDTTAGNASSANVSVSNCAYYYRSKTSGPALDQVRSTHNVGILVRAAKDSTGADSNKAQFTTAKPAGVQDVSGYGDGAYWNPKYGQLNILVGNNWYIISNYTGLNGTSGTLAQAKQFADALKPNLK